MPLGPGGNDARGVYKYGEDDLTGPLFSDFLNLAPASISTQFVADRARLTALEANTAWTTAAMNAGWTGEASNPIQYRVANKLLQFRGRASYNSAAGGATTTMFTLPAGSRPDHVGNQVYICDATGAVRVNLLASGAVVLLTGGSQTTLSLSAMNGTPVV